MDADDSLQISRVTDMDAGVYIVRADNGIGENPAEAKVELIVYPLPSSVSIDLEQTIFGPGEDIVLPCNIRGYPPPKIQWYKVTYWRGRRNETRIPQDDGKRYIETVPLGSVTFRSNLNIRNASSEDSGSYKCEAKSQFTSTVADLEGISIQYGPGQLCIDRPSYKHCDKVVEHKFCGNIYYGQYCCLSCTRAGFVPGPVTPRMDV